MAAGIAAREARTACCHHHPDAARRCDASRRQSAPKQSANCISGSLPQLRTGWRQGSACGVSAPGCWTDGHHQAFHQLRTMPAAKSGCRAVLTPSFLKFHVRRPRRSSHTPHHRDAHRQAGCQLRETAGGAPSPRLDKKRVSCAPRDELGVVTAVPNPLCACAGRALERRTALRTGPAPPWSKTWRGARRAVQVKGRTCGGRCGAALRAEQLSAPAVCCTVFRDRMAISPGEWCCGVRHPCARTPRCANRNASPSNYRRPTPLASMLWQTPFAEPSLRLAGKSRVPTRILWAQPC